MMAFMKYRNWYGMPAFQGPWLTCLACVMCLVTANAGESPVSGFLRDVQPIFENHCVECHNPTRKKGGLDLSTFHGLARGGLNGLVVHEGDTAASPLHSVLAADADPHMPPKKQLAEAERLAIGDWISTLSPNSLAALQSVDVDQVMGQEVPAGKTAADASGWHPPESWTHSQVIDHWIDARLQREGIHAAPLTDDLRFLRRLTLDLTGRLPDPDRVEEFIFDGSPDKRERLIGELLHRTDYGVHMRELFDGVTMGRRGKNWEDRRQSNQWFAFLEAAFNQNRPWNDVVSDLIEARPDHPDRHGAIWFLYERENNYQAMAEAIAPLAFGTQMKCAQCHDHPLAHEIKQSHYWAMVTAFNRSKNTDLKNGIGLAESAIGGFLEFANLKKETQTARLDFFNGIYIPESSPSPGEKEENNPDLYLVPPVGEKDKPETPSLPKFSRRQLFARAVAYDDNFLLARGMVNRMWAHLLVRGLVHPVDEINSFYPASHPELLDWLARQFMASGFDVHWLIRQIASSRTYQRGRATEPRAIQDPSLFAGSLEKTLSAETLWRILLQASGNVNQLHDDAVPEAIQQLRSRLIEFFPDLFPVEMNVSLQQAMFLSNSPQIQFLLESRPGNLANELLREESTEALVRRAFRRILMRNPDAEELRQSVSFLDSRLENREHAVGYFLWALFNSPEFLMNL